MTSPEKNIEYLNNQLRALERENQQLKRDKEMLLDAAERLETKFDADKAAISKVEELKKQISFKDNEIERLNQIVSDQSLTIKSLQENMISKEVHKIPTMQKTIVFLRSMIKDLESEIEKLKNKNER